MTTQPKRSTSSSGSTANKRARELLERHFPLVQYAGKKIVRKPDGTMFSAGEDLMNGTLDAIAYRPLAPALWVQWTSSNRGSLSYRRRKIERGVCEPILEALRTEGDGRHARVIRERIAREIQLELWAYIKRQGFRVHRWHWGQWSWEDTRAMVFNLTTAEVGDTSLRQGGLRYETEPRIHRRVRRCRADEGTADLLADG